MQLTEQLEELADKIYNDDFLTPLEHTPLSFWDCLQPDGIAPDPRAVQECKRLKLKMVPIIAVLGGKNSGKTTLVKKFLSEENHPRLLIGDNTDQGTNRFVLWLPENWSQNQDKLEECTQWIETAFGHTPEELPLEPQAARQRQYDMDDQGIQLDTPLLGFDKKLNELQLAVLDCPDMEVPHAQVTNSVEDATEIRRKALQRASLICSCFFVLMHVRRLEAEIFKDTFQNVINSAEDKLPIYLVVSQNKSPSYNVTKEAIKRLERLALSSRVLDVIECPWVRKGDEVTYCHAEELRFDPVRESVKLKPSSAELERLYSGLNSLEEAINKTKGKIDLLNQISRDRRVKIQKELLEFIDAHFVDDHGSLRNIYTPEDSKILFDAFYASAPRLIKANLVPIKILRNTKALFLCPMKHLPIIREMLQVRSKMPRLQSEHVTEEDFASNMKYCFESPPERVESLKAVWSHTFEYLGDNHYLEMNLDPRELEDAFKDAWVPIRGAMLKLKLTAFVVLSFLLIILALVVEAIAFTGGAAVVAAASLPEIFGAIGLGALSGGLVNPRVCKLYEAKVARPQLSRLYAVLQDGLYLKRAPDSVLKSCSQNNRLKLFSVKKDEVEHMDPIFDQTDEEYTILENARPLLNAIDDLKNTCRE